jgi:hypothetical protein
MWTIIKLAMVDTMSLQYIGISSVTLAKILITVTLRKGVPLLADYCRAFVPDIV